MKFDCITMWGVLEHLNDPINFYLKQKKLTKMVKYCLKFLTQIVFL